MKEMYKLPYIRYLQNQDKSQNKDQKNQNEQDMGLGGEHMKPEKEIIDILNRVKNQNEDYSLQRSRRFIEYDE